MNSPAGHHSIFAQLLCDESCQHPVNGTVFFSVIPPSQSKGTLSSEAYVRAPQQANVADVADLDAGILSGMWSCTSNDLFAFGLGGVEEANSSAQQPTSQKLCDALTYLGKNLEHEAQLHPKKASVWLDLARVAMARGRVQVAVSLYRRALRVHASRGAQRSGEDGWQLDACRHLHEAMHMQHIMGMETVGQGAWQRAYLDYLRLKIPRGDRRRTDAEDGDRSVVTEGSIKEHEVVFGVVSGRRMYETRARAVAETWMAPGPQAPSHLTHTYMYGDLPHLLRGLHVRQGVASLREIHQVPVPDTVEHAFLARLAHHDDFFSSVPKFVLALLDLHARHSRASWYYIAGCDTYLVAENLLHTLRGLDPQRRLMVGGHAGMHFDSLFLSGGSGLVFSRAYLEALSPLAPRLLRAWMEVEGARYRCTPCADIFFVHVSRLLDAEMVQRPGFFAFWPQYYVSSGPSLHGNGTATVTWTSDGLAEAGSAGGPVGECENVPVFSRGLGASASAWWGRLNVVQRETAVAFHYLQPRAMRLLHTFFAASASEEAAS